MGVVDDNPQIKVIRVDLIDLGNANTKFTRTYIYDEDGLFLSFSDMDLNGVAYTATTNVEKEGAGTTNLNLGDLETVTTLVDNLDGTATYTNENGVAVTITLGGGGGGGAVTSVAGKTGAVTLVKADITDFNENDYATGAEGDLAATAIQPAAIANFETSTQLDTRDANNRDRANHTGTQLASTISDFSAAVRAVILSGLSIVSTAAVTATDTVLSAIGKLQARTALLFYGEFARNETGLINNTTTEEDFLVLNASVPVAGNYKIDWAYSWSSNDIAQDCIVRLYVDGVVVWTQQQEAKDSAGTGIALPDTVGGTSNSGTNQRHLVSSFDIISLTAGANEIKITLDSSANGDLNTIYKGVVSIRKWGLS